MVFSLLINSNGKKSSVLLDSILTHLYATTKFLKIWVSENPISSHLVQSEVTSSTLIPNKEALYSICEQYLHACWDEEEVIFVQYTRSTFFFLAVCILWNGNSVHGIHVWLTFAIAIEGSLSSHLKRNLQGNSDSRYILRNCSDQYFHWAGCNKRVQFGRY